MDVNITQDYVNIGSVEQPQQVHFRRAGTGPPLVMLHASPMSSAAVLPFIKVAAEFCTVLAPDTPGYGGSDPLPQPGGDLTGYVAALNEFTQRLGLRSFGLYGTATGAQLALEFSKTHSARVDYLILDNAAHFTDAERHSIVRGYFPDLTPDTTGSHLTRIWSMARDQCVFFPWYQTGSATRLSGGGVNTELVQQLAMDFLHAGKDYDRAYRAAFANEKMERVQPVTAPTIIMRWQGSILKQYTDRFDSVAWPDNFTMLHCGPTRAQRAQGFRRIFTEHRPQAHSRDCHINHTDPRGRAGKGFIELDSGQCHYQFAGDAQQPPVLALHDVGSSQRALSPPGLARSGSYHVIAPDLPGHGLSPPAPAARGGIDGAVDNLAELVETLGWSSLQIQAEQDSAALAVELARRLGASVTALKLVEPLDYVALAAEWDWPRLRPDFTPDSAGTHLLRTWHWLRDRQLYWPWYARDAAHALPGEPKLEADYLNARLTEFWQAGPGLDELRQQIVNYPLSKYLDKLDCTVELCQTTEHPLAEVGRRSLGR